MRYYEIEFKPKAIKDLQCIPRPDGQKIVERLKLLRDNLQGDIKRLTNYTPEFRMRVGDWRILFEVELEVIIVYRILHRKEAYK